MMRFLPSSRRRVMVSRTAVAPSPTTSRPFKSRITMPSRSRLLISRCAATSLVYPFRRQHRSFRLRRAGQHRQAHDEAGSAPRLGFDLDTASVRFRDPGNKAQPQAEAFFRIAGGDLVETVEDVGQVLAGDADARILYDEH